MYICGAKGLQVLPEARREDVGEGHISLSIYIYIYYIY